MDTGYYKIYESKFKLACWEVMYIAFILAFLYFVEIPERKDLWIIIGLIVILIDGIVIFSKLFTHDAYVEITPTYIRISNFEKLLWTDIENITDYVDLNRLTRTKAKRWWIVNVKDVSKYRLTLTQKLCGFYRDSPFYILPRFLSKKDRELLSQILHEHSPDYKRKISDI